MTSAANDAQAPMHFPDPDPGRASGDPASPASPAAALHWQRCFVALTPVRATADQLALASGPGIRAVHPANLHLTLAFIGDLPAELGQEVARTLPSLAQPLRCLPLEAIEWWPDSIRPRVLVATFTANDELLALVDHLRTRLAQAGLPTGNAFRAHLTLARASRRITAEAAASAARHADPPTHACFTALTLYATRPDGPAGQYWQAASIPLGEVLAGPDGVARHIP